MSILIFGAGEILLLFLLCQKNQKKLYKNLQNKYIYYSFVLSK